ncbi:MAG TPA: SRPBCC domain-containing protein [Polyangiaceae bacterium]|nr:SRPBCC domain-containing protein [Polyangiaceae bacterium]
MSGYDLTREYPVPIELVWRSLTEAELVAAWTATGRGGHPVGFEPTVATKFQFIGKPTPGWNGIVDCEVLEVQEPTHLRFSWRGGADDDVTTVTCSLEPTGTGTRLRWQHTGFTGVGGFIVSRILCSVRKKMFDLGLPPVLERLAKEGRG